VALSLELDALSDVGRHRTRNEDAVATDRSLGLLVVADGMGGHPAGHVASRLAVESVVEAFATDPGYTGPEGERMAKAVRAADDRVRSEGLRDPSRAGMGTTLTVLRVDLDGGRWVLGHVGDSRAYRFRGGHLEALTRDDTWVQEQIEAGRMEPEEARAHPYSSVLSQALGVNGAVDPTVVDGEVADGDLYLLCSDGLTAHLPDDRIREIVAETSDRGVGPVVQALVDAANADGGVDNITVALARIGEGSEPGPA
jgi:protein phosphatase